MKKVVMLFGCAFALLCGTSCERDMEIERTFVSSNEVTCDEKIERLVQQVRMGDVESYDTLAACYRDGEGVKQSYLNMLTMYTLASRRKGRSIKEVINSLDADNPLRLFIDVLDRYRPGDVPQSVIDKLKSVSPADVFVYDAICAIDCDNDTIASERLLKEAEVQGSEMACILQVGLYHYLGYKEKYKQSLIKFAERFPVLYVRLGDLYMEDTCEGHWEQAVRYYILADYYGMLTIQGARNLSTAYRMLEQAGKIKCNQQEMERLEILAKYKQSEK